MTPVVGMSTVSDHPSGVPSAVILTRTDVRSRKDLPSTMKEAKPRKTARNWNCMMAERSESLQPGKWRYRLPSLYSHAMFGPRHCRSVKPCDKRGRCMSGCTGEEGETKHSFSINIRDVTPARSAYQSCLGCGLSFVVIARIRCCHNSRVAMS